MTAELVVRDTGGMPRRPPKPEAGPDEWAAWRIEFERERLGLSLAELARQVTAAGAPMQHQAIWQIENRQPPRKISFGEAVAFCQVFGIRDVAELGRRPDVIAREFVAEVRRLVRDWLDTGQRLIEQLRELQAHSDADPDVWRELLGDLTPELDAVVKIREQVIEAGRGQPSSGGEAAS